MRCVLVDLDGTLLPNPSAELRFIKYLLHNRFISKSQFLYRSVGFIFKFLFHLRADVFVKNKAYLANLNVKTVEDAANNFVKKELIHLFSPRLLANVKQHQRMGLDIVLLTGAPEFIANIIADHLGFDAVIATRFIAKNGFFLACPPWQHPYNREKLSLATEFCKSQGYQLCDCIAYADSLHDITLLAAVGHAVVVNPNKKLALIAADNGWSIW